MIIYREIIPLRRPQTEHATAGERKSAQVARGAVVPTDGRTHAVADNQSVVRKEGVLMIYRIPRNVLKLRPQGPLCNSNWAGNYGRRYDRGWINKQDQ